MMWLAENVGSSLIAIAIALSITYLLYLFRQRLMVSVQIMVETTAPTPEIRIVITNHGRSAAVITELDVHVCVDEITLQAPSGLEDSPLTLNPVAPKPPKRPPLSLIRQKLGTFGSESDRCALYAELRMSKGAGKIDVLNGIETITVMPNEKVSRLLEERESHPLAPKVKEINPLVLIPSCRVAKKKHAVWGRPAIVSIIDIGEHRLPMVIQF